MITVLTPIDIFQNQCLSLLFYVFYVHSPDVTRNYTFCSILPCFFRLYKPISDWLRNATIVYYRTKYVKIFTNGQKYYKE